MKVTKEVEAKGELLSVRVVEGETRTSAPTEASEILAGYRSYVEKDSRDKVSSGIGMRFYLSDDHRHFMLVPQWREGRVWEPPIAAWVSKFISEHDITSYAFIIDCDKSLVVGAVDIEGHKEFGYYAIKAGRGGKRRLGKWTDMSAFWAAELFSPPPPTRH